MNQLLDLCDRGLSDAVESPAIDSGARYPEKPAGPRGFCIRLVVRLLGIGELSSSSSSNTSTFYSTSSPRLRTNMTSTDQSQQAPNCQFQDRLSSALLHAQASSHEELNGHGHQHSAADGHVHTHGPGGTWTPDEHGHTHEHLEDAGAWYHLALFQPPY